MKKAMPRLLIILALATALPALAQDRADSVLVVADDGALDASAVHAIRNVAASELRKHGIALVEDVRAAGVRPVDAGLSQLAAELGARRLFALRIGGRLGAKIPLSLEELMPNTLAPVYSSSLTALGLEECDIVTARLVNSVLDRRNVENNAGMRSVTLTEARPFMKKPGERFWFLGLPVPVYGGGTPFGFSVGYGYEAESFRINASAGVLSRDTSDGSNRSDGIAYLVLEAAWIPLDGEISPYIGAGLGYMGTHQAGMGGTLEAGIEAFRLHGVRGLAGFQVLIPFFDNSWSDYDPTTGGQTKVASRSWYPAAFVRFAF
jgi:hypothetical protein